MCEGCFRANARGVLRRRAIASTSNDVEEGDGSVGTGG